MSLQQQPRQSSPLLTNNNNNNNNNQNHTFKFSPSIFAAWSYFNCPRQLRFSLEKVKKDFSTFPSSNNKNNSNDNNNNNNNTKYFDSGFPSLSGQETMGRGNIFEASIFDVLEKNQQISTFINFDNIGVDKSSLKKTMEEIGIEHFFVEKIFMEQVLPLFFSRSDEDKKKNQSFYLAQVPLTGTKELEKSLFCQNQEQQTNNNNNNNTISFSTMYPDILIVNISLVPDNAAAATSTLKISVKIVDVKSSKKMKPGHCMQVATYFLVLKSLFLSTCVPVTKATDGVQTTRAPFLDAISSKFPCAKISKIDWVVEKEGEIWLPSSSSPSTTSNNNNQLWKESPFPIDPDFTNQVREFVANILLPLVVNPKTNTKSYASFLTKTGSNNNNNKNDMEDIRPRSDDVDVPYPLESRGMNSVCATCDFKLRCKKSVLTNQYAIPTPSIDEQLDIVRDLEQVEKHNKTPTSLYYEKLDEVFFRKSIAAVPYPFANNNNDDNNNIGSASAAINGDSTSTSGSPAVITADLASSNLFLEYIWKCATKYSCLKIACALKWTSKGNNNNNDDDQNEMDVSARSFCLPFVTSHRNNNSNNNACSSTTDPNVLKNADDFKNRCNFIDKYIKKYFPSANYSFFSPIEIANSYFQTSRPSRMLTLNPLVTLSPTKTILLTSFSVVLTTKNSATNHSDIHRIIISEQEVVFASIQLEKKNLVWNNTNAPNAKKSPPTIQTEIVESFEIDLSKSESEARIIFDEDFNGSSSNDFYERMFQALSNNDDKMNPRHFVVWDSQSGKLLAEDIFPNMVLKQKQQQENSHSGNSALQSAFGFGDLVAAHDADEVPPYQMIDFFYPRISILSDTLNSHFCFSSSCGGTLELNEAADSILEPKQQNRLLPPYISLNDFGLPPRTTAERESLKNTSLARQVPKLISQVFCKTYEIVSKTASSCLRSWSSKRSTALSGAGSTSTTSSSSSSSSSTKSPNPIAEPHPLYYKFHQTLSFQATASWLDRGNPTCTFLGSFPTMATPTRNPSFYRLDVKFLLKKPVVSSSSKKSSSSRDERLRQISVAKSALIDSIANDALWRNDVDAMRKAIQSFETNSTTTSTFRFCQKDGALDEIKKEKGATTSRAGRWYLITTSETNPNTITKKETLENLFDASKMCLAGRGLYVSGGGRSASSNESSAFLCGKYCLAVSSTSGTDFFDSVVADERHVFRSSFASFASPRKQEYVDSDVVLCDIVCVEDLTTTTTTSSSSSSGSNDEPSFVTLGLHLYIHNNKHGPKQPASFSSSSAFHCLSPRLVNVNFAKTLQALKELTPPNSAFPVSTLLVESATSPRPMIIPASSSNSSNKDDILNITAQKILADVNRSLTHHKINLSEEHKNFLNHVDNFPATILWGPPGAGKTQTLALTILSFLLAPPSSTSTNSQSGKNVLIVAATNKALQQLHEKLDDLGRLLNAEVSNQNQNPKHNKNNNDDDDQDTFHSEISFFEDANNHAASTFNFSSYYANNKISVQRIDSSEKKETKVSSSKNGNDDDDDDDDDENEDDNNNAKSNTAGNIKAGKSLPTASMSRTREVSVSVFQKSKMNNDQATQKSLTTTAAAVSNEQEDEDNENKQEKETLADDDDDESTDNEMSTPTNANPFNQPETNAVATPTSPSPASSSSALPNNTTTTSTFTTTATSTTKRGPGRPRKDAPPVPKPEPKPRGRPKTIKICRDASPVPALPGATSADSQHSSTIAITNDSVPTYQSYGCVSDFSKARVPAPIATGRSKTSRGKKSDESSTGHSIVHHNIVICTMWKANALAKAGIAFDVLVVDEASQIQFIHAVAASLLLKKNDSSSRLIVAGDPLQFSPIISDGVSSFSSSSSSNFSDNNYTSGKGFSSQTWTRMKEKAVNSNNTSENENDKFNLATASVFDALMFDQESQQRFTDIVALTSSSNENNTNNNERTELCGMYQLPHSFRSTPEIVQIVQKLYPKFSIFPESNFLINSMHFNASGSNKFPRAADRSRGVGIFVTVIKDPANEASVIADRVYTILNSVASNNDRSSNATSTSTEIAIVTPRRHQRAKIRETLTTTPAKFLGVALADAIINSKNNNNNNNNTNRINQLKPEDFSSSRIVVDTTERMQGDQAKAVIIALADVRNTKFALNLRRLNVAVSRAIRYVELVIHEKLFSDSGLRALEEELKEFDNQEDEEEQISRSGKPKTYCLRSLEFLKHFEEVARERGGNGAFSYE